jgi:hypothetical protein
MTSAFLIGHVLFTVVACMAIMGWQWKHALRIVDGSMRRQEAERPELSSPEDEPAAVSAHTRTSRAA